MQEEILTSTSKKQEMMDITGKVNSIVKKSKIKQGLCNIFVTHATAAVVINENADQNICLDTIEALDGLVKNGIWRHDKIDNNAASHIKASIIGPSQTIPIKNNELQLGKWQAISLLELDGPRRNRKIIVQVIGD